MSDVIAGDGLSREFDPEGAARAALDALGTAPAVLVLFTGQRGSAAEAAGRAAALAQGAPVVVVEGAGVLTSAGEVEGGGVAAFALGGAGVEAKLRPLHGDADAAREGLAAAAEDSMLVWAALTPPLYGPDVVAAVGGQTQVPVVGGGASKVVVVMGGAPMPVEGAALGVRARGLRVASVVSPAAKLLTEWRPLTEVKGPFLLSAGGTSMLEWISSTPGTDNAGAPTFVAVRASTPGAAPLLRTVRGIDPKRGGVAVAEPIECGTEVALAVWDGSAARQDLRMRLGALARELGGGVPVAGFLMTCLGRGVDLFGERDVDVSEVRARVGSMPFAGMFSQFEIARFDGAPRIHLYTASLALLYRPN